MRMRFRFLNPCPGVKISHNETVSGNKHHIMHIYNDMMI